MGMRKPNLVPLRGVFAGLIVAASFAAVLTTAAVGAGNQTVMEKSLLTQSNVPVPVRAILERACQDCHSENTVWPWYSHIPPISAEIHTDVESGRAFMDLSKWETFSESKRRGFITAIGAAVENHVMPPPKYVRMHRGARLSSDDLELVRAWALANSTNRNRR
jgi:uncharacterized membrane protein